MSKVKSTALISATVKYSNESDTERVYAIEGHVGINEGTVTHVTSGTVHKDDVLLASFNHWNHGEQQINWRTNEVDDKNAIQQAIDAFIENVTVEVSTSTISL